MLKCKRSRVPRSLPPLNHYRPARRSISDDGLNPNSAVPVRLLLIEAFEKNEVDPLPRPVNEQGGGFFREIVGEQGNAHAFGARQVGTRA